MYCYKCRTDPCLFIWKLRITEEKQSSLHFHSKPVSARSLVVLVMSAMLQVLDSVMIGGVRPQLNILLLLNQGSKKTDTKCRT